MSGFTPFAGAHDPDGHTVGWRTADGEHRVTCAVRWENEGFTVTGTASRERVEIVVRTSPTWQLRQFLLFRDLAEPDLWLATDGHGRWGEMNGAHRTELDGCIGVLVAGMPLTHTLTARRLPLHDGHSAEVPLAVVDVDTLEVRRVVHRYTRHDAAHWTVSCSPSGGDRRPPTHHSTLLLDAHGLVIEQVGAFVRDGAQSTDPPDAR